MPFRTALAALLLVCAAALHADALKVGQDAPNFKVGGEVINPPEFAREFKDCKGGVILVYEWQARDTTKAALPEIQKYWEKWKGLGLYVWTIHRLNFEKFPQIDIMARSNGWTFPICMGGFYDDKNDFSHYKAGKEFRTTVVGGDGKVAYYGHDDGWKKVLEDEMAKIVYPNLGKNEVADKLEMAAKAFAKRDFGKALNFAEKRLKEELTDAEKDDAELIVKQAMQIADRRNERIKKWEGDKRYDLAMKTLEALKEEFKGHKVGDDAYAEIKRLKKDKDIKKELKSFDMLEQMIDKRGKDDPQAFISALQFFAKQQQGMRSAKVATDMVQRIKLYME